MSGLNKVFGQAGENPRNLPDSLLKMLTIKNRGNSPWETLKSFGSNPSKKETYVSIIVKLGPEGRMMGSKRIARSPWRMSVWTSVTMGKYFANSRHNVVGRI